MKVVGWKAGVLGALICAAGLSSNAGQVDTPSEASVMRLLVQMGMRGDAEQWGRVRTIDDLLALTRQQMQDDASGPAMQKFIQEELAVFQKLATREAADKVRLSAEGRAMIAGQWSQVVQLFTEANGWDVREPYAMKHFQQLFTQAEVDRLNDFIKTPVGLSAIKKLDVVSVEQTSLMSQISPQLEKQMQVLKARAAEGQAILDKYTRKAPTPPKVGP